MSRKSLRTFIQLVPGPQSYCKCDTLCSPVTIEHVIPKSLVKKSHNPSVANDLHNIYPCCLKMNQRKGSKLFGEDFLLNDGLPITGSLSRACLYMQDVYELPIDQYTVSLWNTLDDFYPPENYEYERNEIIYERTGFYNPFIGKHLKDID